MSDYPTAEEPLSDEQLAFLQSEFAAGNIPDELPRRLLATIDQRAREYGLAMRASVPIPMDAEETAAMEHLFAFMRQIKEWGLRYNTAELTGAIHVLQGFLVQHMLGRLDPRWSNWYADREDVERG